MEKIYPSDVSKEQFDSIKSILEKAKKQQSKER